MHRLGKNQAATRTCRFSSFVFAFSALLCGFANAQADSVNSVSGPTTVSPNTNVSVAVGYTVSGTRKIKVHFQRTTDWAWFGAGEVNVNSGSGTANVSVPTGSSTNGSSYRYGVEILNGTKQTASGSQSGITVGSVATTDGISAVNGPTTVSANSNVSVPVTYSATGSRTIKVHFQNPGNNWAWYGAGQVNVGSGSGTVDVSVSTGSAPGGGGYIFNAEMLNGSTQTASRSQTGITVGTSSGGRVRKNIGTNFWFIYENSTSSDWTGGGVWRAPNLNFASETNPWSTNFLNELKPYQVLRFMDWYGGNGDSQSDWNTHRTRKGDLKQFGGTMQNDSDGDGYANDIARQTQSDGRQTTGVAVEWLIDLSNRNASDMWINVPYRAINADDFPNGDDFNNEYVHKLAILLKHGVDMRGVNLKNWVGGKANLNQLANKSKQDFINAGGVDTGQALNSSLKIYVEYSNELWCCERPQVKYILDQAYKIGFGGQYDRRFGAYAEVRSWKAFQDVFGSSAMGNRIIRVAGPTHAENGTAGAFAGFFNDVYRNTAAKRNPWYNNGSGVYMDAWKWASYIGGDPANWNASVDSDANFSKTFAQNMKTAYNIKYFLSYEGGQHLDSRSGPFAWSNGYNAYNAYKYWLDKEDDAFDLIVHYAHYGKWQSSTDTSGYGSWGAKSYVGQPESESGKYRALKDYANGS